MIVSFSPIQMDDTLTVSRHSDILTINGDTVDLSVIPDGATLPAGAIDNPWIVGPVQRIDGVLHVTLLLPHGDFPSLAVAWPTPITLTGNGPVAVPHDPAPQEADHGND
ncbi:hypothetical protein [Aquamicrobium sp.]|uniref:hypothetical protein n=1 Tax=Aquamicrobium sp. TaxID=1872579 RepID=UPI002589729B|nr:hypothetical protein [Aquamicrobium sp.]MCK9550648.1 hypothetical protein [Aquamicrobium sp.]